MAPAPKVGWDAPHRCALAGALSRQRRVTPRVGSVYGYGYGYGYEYGYRCRYSTAHPAGGGNAANPKLPSGGPRLTIPRAALGAPIWEVRG